MAGKNLAFRRWHEAKKWVLHQGMRTNFEYIFAYDAVTGVVIARETNELPGMVAIPSAVKEMAKDRSRKIGIHHNHPNSSGLTGADFLILASNPGIGAIIAHGHDGSDYIASAVERGNIAEQLHCVLDALYRIVRNDSTAILLQNRGVLTPLMGHLLGLALCASGVIAYKAKLSVKAEVLYQLFQPDIDTWVNAAVLSCPIVRR